MSQEMIEIDGAMLEGGGQILRLCVSLSALTGKGVRIRNIRAGRSKPGLRPQHLTALQLVRDLTRGRLEGASVGATHVTFSPGGPVKGGKYEADTGTAGSVVLVWQASFPCLLYADAPSELVLSGGTDADMAPPIDYALMVFKPMVEKLGAKFSCDILRRGSYPRGGGKACFRVPPLTTPLHHIDLIRGGPIVGVSGKAFVAGQLPVKVSHAMADAAKRALRATFPSAPVDIQRTKEPQVGGAAIVLAGKTETGCLLGGSALLKRGESGDCAGERAASELASAASAKTCVDSYLQDQLIVFMALAAGRSRMRIGGPPTLHTQTAVRVAEMMTQAKFTIGADEESYVIECQGIGLKPPSYPEPTTAT